MKITRVVLGVTVGGLLALQLVPPQYPRDNPPSEATIAGPPEVVRILRRSCFDCHSHETDWPFYAWIAPISWRLAADVAGARSRLNFSEWENLRAGFRRRNARKIVERIEKGEMPMPEYLWLHPAAAVSPEELDTLRAWRDRLQADSGDSTAPADDTDIEEHP